MTFIKISDPSLKIKVGTQEFVGTHVYEVDDKLAKQLIESNMAIETDKPENEPAQ